MQPPTLEYNASQLNDVFTLWRLVTIGKWALNVGQSWSYHNSSNRIKSYQILKSVLSKLDVNCGKCVNLLTIKKIQNWPRLTLGYGTILYALLRASWFVHVHRPRFNGGAKSESVNLASVEHIGLYSTLRFYTFCCVATIDAQHDVSKRIHPHHFITIM